MPLDKACGCLERSKFWVSDYIGWFETSHTRAGLKSICIVEAVRKIVKSGEAGTTRRYYISSRGEKDSEKTANAIHGYWATENELHWCLDMAFDEDRSRARSRNAAKNLGLMSGITMNLLRES